MKKILSALLTLCVALSLMPVTARADGVSGIKVKAGDTLQELKAGEYAENHGTIVTNNGTVYNYDTGTVTTNNGTVTDNYGTVTTNNGTVTTNYSGGKVTYNKQIITGNEGYVYGNDGTVTINIGTINFNRNSVDTNAPSGTIDTNRGSVAANSGTITTNDNYYGNEVVDENYGKIELNKSTVRINYGTVTANAAGGIVRNLTSSVSIGTVGTNSGEVYEEYIVGYGCGSVGTNTSTGTEYFQVLIYIPNIHTAVSSTGLKSAFGKQWLGEAAGVQATAAVTLTPAEGYEIKEISGLPSNVTASKNADGTWTLTVTSGIYTNINIPRATVKPYTVTVNNGSGGGEYAAGVLVTITADEPSWDKLFKEWTGTDGLDFTSGGASTATATFTMPKHDVTVTATYDNAYTLTVRNGSGTGKYMAGASVTITANNPPEGQRFKEWSGLNSSWITSGSETTTTVTFRMPSYTHYVEATYEEIPPSFASHSLALGGKIGVIFYMSIPERYRENSYLTFSISDGGGCTERADFDAAFKDKKTDSLYGFTCYVNSIQMADTVTAVFHYGDGQTVTEEYSVRDYFTSFENQVSNGEITDESTIALVRALADYGHYIRPFLEDYHGSDLYTGYNVLPARAGQLTAVNHNSEGLSASAPEFDLNGGLKAQYSMVFDSDTTLKVYFSGDVSSITVDDRQLTDLSSPIEIKSIKPQDFDVLHTIIFNA